MATKRAWGAQDSRRVSLQPQIWNVQWLGCTHLILLCDRRLLVGSLMMCRQCWSWACSTGSTTGGITGKWSQKRWDWRKAQNQRTPCMLCHWKAYLWLLDAFGMLVAKQLSFGQVGLSSKLKTYVRTRYKALVGPKQKVWRPRALDKPIGTVSWATRRGRPGKHWGLAGHDLQPKIGIAGWI